MTTLKNDVLNVLDKKIFLFYMNLKFLKEQNLQTLQNMAEQLNLSNFNKDTKNTLAFRIYMKTTNKFNKKSTKLLNSGKGKELIEISKKSKENMAKNDARTKALAHIKNNDNFENLISLNSLNKNTTNFRLYTIIVEGNKAYVTSTRNLLKSMNTSLNTFYAVRSERVKTKYGVQMIKVIKRTIKFYRLSIPHNMMISELDYKRIERKMQNKEIVIIQPVKTESNVGEVVSIDFADNEGSLVGAYHGHDKIYKLFFL
jgi:hypothetical protein